MGWLYVNNKEDDQTPDGRRNPSVQKPWRPYSQTRPDQARPGQDRQDWGDRQTMIDLTGQQWTRSSAYAKNIDPQQVQMVVNSDGDASGYMPLMKANNINTRGVSSTERVVLFLMEYYFPTICQHLSNLTAHAR